ncbi:MAG: efflux RND transporter permease subunit [Bryobacterales bacterium]
MSLPEFSIHRPVTVIMACLMAVLLGGIAFVEIPVDLMPETEYPTLSVNVGYPGVAPQEMETLVARPLEQALAATPGVEEITSSSSEGRASVRLRFGYGTNLDEAAAEMRSRLDRRRSALPDDIEPPTLYKYDVSQYPILYLTVSSPEMDAKELRFFAEKNIQYRLERAPGVAATDIRGGLRRQIQVKLSLEKLQALNLSVNDVVSTLRNENLNRPVGPVQEGRYEVLVRTEGEFDDIQDILDVAVATRNGVNIYIRDIATVEDSHEDVRFKVSVDGKPAVRLYVYKQSGANTVEVAQVVREEVDKINRDYSSISVGIPWDSSEFIVASVNNVKTSTMVGGLLAIFVLLFFLRSFTSTLIIGVAIPISVIATFALMYFNGFTLNTVSFGGLALGVGMLVDNAIVVLENIFRHREEGLDGKEAAILGSKEVSVAITASTLTTIAVFVPVLFMQGVAGQTFQQLAWVVSFALFCSLLSAITIVPMLCSKFLRKQRTDKSRGLSGWIGRRLDGLSRTYENTLGWSLDHRAIVAGSAALLFAGAVYVWPLIGVELEPELDEGMIWISVTLEPGTRVEVTDQVMKRMEQTVREHVPEARSIMSEAGSDSTWRAEGGNEGDMRIYLIDQDERERSAAEIAGELRGLLTPGPGMIVQTRVRGSVRTHGGSAFGDGRLSVEVRGHDPEISKRLADEALAAMLSTDGVASAQLSRQPGTPELVVRVDRQKAHSMGLTVSQVAQAMETAIGGTRASMYREEGDEFDILVRLAEQDRLDISQIGQVSCGCPTEARSLPRRSSTQRREGPVEITRADQQRIIVVSGIIEDRDLGSVVQDLRAKLGQISRPADYEFIFGGEYEEQQEAFRQMTFAALLALLLVYMVMAAQFESVRDPFIILFSAPLAFVGVALTLLLTGTTFNMQGFLGVIVLVGIVVNNAIVLVDYTNLLRREHGYGVRDAVVTAGSRRLRPILMTTITTVLGLLPMALGLGEGGELQAPMARVVIGGLTSSTLITLVFIPVVYFTLERAASRGRRRAPRISTWSPPRRPATRPEPPRGNKPAPQPSTTVGGPNHAVSLERQGRTPIPARQAKRARPRPLGRSSRRDRLADSEQATPRGRAHPERDHTRDWQSQPAAGATHQGRAL